MGLSGKLVLGTTLIAVAAGMLPSAGAAPTERPRFGTVRGVVTTADGKPLPDAVVKVYAYSNDPDRVWDEIAHRRTDDTGHYRVPKIPVGRVMIRFDNLHDDHGVDEWAAEFWRDATTVEDATPIRIRAGQVLRRNAQLQPGASISGRLTLADGSPAVGGGAVLSRPGDPSDVVVDEDVIGQDGRYRIDGLSPGTYQLQFYPGGLHDPSEWYGDTPDRAYAEPITLAAGDERVIDDQLPEEATLSAAVRTSSGATSRPSLVLYRADPDGGWSFAGDASVRYPFTGLESGTYRLYFARVGDQTGFWWPHARDIGSADDIVLAPGEDRSVSATSEVGATISGTVYDADGSPRSRTSVAVYRKSSDGSWFRLPRSQRSQDLSGSDGRYTVEGLVRGHYRLYFYGGRRGKVESLGEWWNNAYRARDARTIFVGTRANLTGIDVHLKRDRG